MCGNIIGYETETLDGLPQRSSYQRDDLDDNYLNGISIQSGASHVWSLVAGMCTDYNNKPSSFIGNDWMCDGTCNGNNYCGNLLWDTPMFGRENRFLKTLSVPSTADTELCVCRDENRDNEDIAITDLRMYVQ